MIPLHLKKAAGATLQKQVYDEIRAAILAGTLKPGTALPSSRECARELKVSRNTIVLAFERLANEGYLRMRSGSGTFVSDPLPEECVGIPTLGSPELTEPFASSGGPKTPLYPAILLKLETLRMVQNGPGQHKIDFRYCSANWRNFPLREWRELLIENISRTSTNISGYGPPEGILELRQAIAKHVTNNRAIPVDPDQVIVTAGAQEALNLVSRLFVRPGVQVAIENPCYRGAALVFRSFDAALFPLPLDDEGACIEPLDQSDASLIYVTPSHQFPTGVTMSAKRRLELLSWAENNRAYIVEDDYDSDFRYDGPPLAALAGLNNNTSVIYLGTFSKSVGSGLRTGYAIVPKHLIEPMRQIKSLANCGHPWFEQIVLADFINGGGLERHIRRIRQAYSQTRAALLKSIHTHLGCVEILGAAGGVHVMATLPLHYPSARDVARVAAQEGVGVYTIETTGAFEIGASRHSRSLILGYALLSPEAATEGIMRIARGLRQANITETMRSPGLVARSVQTHVATGALR
jgi:GntR family transcriptional regulator/MocR family aminotransferase